MKIIIIEDDHFFQNFYSLKLKDLYEVEWPMMARKVLKR